MVAVPVKVDVNQPSKALLTIEARRTTEGQPEPRPAAPIYLGVTSSLIRHASECHGVHMLNAPMGAADATVASVHRTMNQRRQSLTATADASMRCECECHRVECCSSFPITTDAYETVRASGRRFVVAPGHQSRDESVFSTARLYVVIEKVGLLGRSAEALNSRPARVAGTS